MEQINHQGRITQINDNKILVEILSQSACHDCSVRHKCGLAECQTKIVEVDNTDNTDYSLGEDVNVGIAATLGFKAVWLCYLIPLLLILAMLCILQILGFSEQISGIFSIIILIPYYFWLFLSKKKLQKQFRFTISKK